MADENAQAAEAAAAKEFAADIKKLGDQLSELTLK